MNYRVFILPFSLLVLSSTTLADAPASANASSKSTYDWTGVYVGGFVGGASGANVTSTEPYSSQPGGGYWNDSGANNNYSTNASFMGGGTVGYNWQIPKTPYLIGLEGEYGYLGQSGSNPDPNSATWNAHNTGLPPDTGSSSAKIGSSYGYGLVGGRIGYTVDRALLYVKSGAVFTSNQSSYNDPSDSGINMTSKANNNAGYALGAGIEYGLPTEWFKLAKNISIKTEYLYFGINRTTTASSTFDGITAYSNTSISGIHTAKIGVNYKF